MRELRFRTWDKEKKKMLYYDTDIVPCMTLNGVLQKLGESETLADDGTFDTTTSIHTNVSYKYSLMQYTGLKDVNGKEIYEGDIISRNGFKRTIVWNDELCCFQAPFSDGSGIHLFTKRELSTFEVIGNIHETPTLLETKTN